MPRTTLDDRARKARINERQHRLLYRQLSKLENITDEQKATLKQILSSTARGEAVKVTAVPEWRTLREMGVVREKDGVLMLTANGAHFVADNQ